MRHVWIGDKRLQPFRLGMERGAPDFGAAAGRQPCVAVVAVHAPEFVVEEAASVCGRSRGVEALKPRNHRRRLKPACRELQHPCKEHESLHHAVWRRQFSTYSRDLLMAAVISGAVGRMGIPLGTGCMKIST